MLQFGLRGWKIDHFWQRFASQAAGAWVGVGLHRPSTFGFWKKIDWTNMNAWTEQVRREVEYGEEYRCDA